MRTLNTKYLFSISFVLALIIGLFFNSVAVLAEHEDFPFEIRSTYTYEEYDSGANNADTIGNCQPGEAFENLVIREERVQRYPDGSQQDFQLQDVIYCLSGQSLYTFNTFANDIFIDIFGDEILVVGATPEEGKKYDATGDIHGIEGTITIANTGLFNSTFPDAATDGADSATAETIDNIEAAEEAEAAAAEDTDPENCETKGGSFSFILCPILQGLSEAFDWIDVRIMNALNVNQEYYENDSVRGAWRNFRNMAYILLIPVMLVMVIGTALNFSFVDAYTVKRALPRMLAAILFITLSFEITSFMVEIFNVIGRGTGGLIASPFGGVDNLQITDVFVADAGDDVAFGGVVLAGVGIAALSGVTIGSLLVTLGLAVLAIFIVFVLLILREMLIIFLMVLSPIAIIAWIFPGNDKPWKFWWQAFSKMLYFYPIVIGLIYAGRAFASIVHSTESDEFVVVSTMIKLIAFVGPYFFIPKAFQFAGGALGNLAGMVNDRGKGVFDRGRKMREGMKAEQRQQVKSGGGGIFGVGKNTKAGRWTGSKGASAYGLGRSVKNNGLVGGLRGSSITAAKNKNISEAAHEFEDKNLDFKAFSADDTVLAAAEAGNGGLKDVKQALIDSGDSRFQGANGDKIAGQTAQLVMQAKNQMGEKAYKKAALVAKAKTGTYYDDAGHMMREINAVYGDDRQAAGAAAIEMRGASMNAGRIDIGGAGAGATLGALTDSYNGYDKDGNTFTYDDAKKKVVNDVLNSQSASSLTHQSMKPQYIVDNILPQLHERIDGTAQGSPERMMYLAQLDNIHQSLQGSNVNLNKAYVQGGGSKTRNEQGERVDSDQSNLGVLNKYAAEVEAVRTDPQFQKYHKEYASSLGDPNDPRIIAQREEMDRRRFQNNDPNNPVQGAGGNEPWRR